MTNSTNKHERPEARGGDQYQVPGSNPVQRWYLLSRSPHQDCLSNGNNGQTEQDLAVHHHQFLKQPCLLTLKKRIQAFETKCLRKFLRSSYLEHKTNDWVRSKTKFPVGPQEPLLATVKRPKIDGSGISNATTASPQPSFRASWRVSDTVVCTGNAGWTSSKSGRPCLCQNCSQGLHAGRTGGESLLNRPSWPPDDPIGQGTKLN